MLVSELASTINLDRKLFFIQVFLNRQLCAYLFDVNSLLFYVSVPIGVCAWKLDLQCWCSLDRLQIL